LFLGNQKDNGLDMVKKGRFIRTNARLTTEIVGTIRSRYSNGETQLVLRKEFGLSSGHISMIVNNKQWKNLDVPTKPSQPVPISLPGWVMQRMDRE
jgi:hypothetical protein